MKYSPLAGDGDFQSLRTMTTPGAAYLMISTTGSADLEWSCSTL